MANQNEEIFLVSAKNKLAAIRQTFGGLEYCHLAYFEIAQQALEVVEFFAGIDDRDFEEQIIILNSELQGEDFAEQLLTNITISKKLLSPIISHYRKRTNNNNNNNNNNTADLLEICKQIRANLPKEEDASKIAIGRIEAVINQFAHVKNVFSRAGGITSLEVIYL